MENCVPGAFVAITRSAKINFIGIAGARSDRLRIEIVRIIVIRTIQPLIIVKMKNMMLFTRMKVPEFDMIVDIAVMYIRWIVGIERAGRLGPNHP